MHRCTCIRVSGDIHSLGQGLRCGYIFANITIGHRGATIVSSDVSGNTSSDDHTLFKPFIQACPGTGFGFAGWYTV